MLKTILMIIALNTGLAGLAHGQLPAVDISAEQIAAFIDALPDDSISDRPIRVVELGGHKAGVYGVFRPATMAGRAIRHETVVAEIYFMLEGSGTLVTGGTIQNEQQTGVSPNTHSPNYAGPSIESGISRRVKAGDVVVIPGNVPHWWSSLDSDIRYLIFRADPEGIQSEK